MFRWEKKNKKKKRKNYIRALLLLLLQKKDKVLLGSLENSHFQNICKCPQVPKKEKKKSSPSARARTEQNSPTEFGMVGVRESHLGKDWGDWDRASSCRGCGFSSSVGRLEAEKKKNHQTLPAAAPRISARLQGTWSRATGRVRSRTSSGSTRTHTHSPASKRVMRTEIQPKTSNFLTQRMSTPEPAFAPPTSVPVCLTGRVHAVHSSQRRPRVRVAQGIDTWSISDRKTYQNWCRGLTRTRCYSVEVTPRERAY